MGTFREIISRMPKEIKAVMEQLPETVVSEVEEIRLRAGQKILLRCRSGERSLNCIMSQQNLQQTLHCLIQYSYYAYEDDIARGFVTIEGGHRVGICGRVVAKEGQPALLKEISSLNIRFAREVKGCSHKVIHLIKEQGKPVNTLIVSPPGCGKTTLLRDLARILSEEGFQTAVCDERSEIAGMYQGKPGFCLGPRCDVLDGCEKAWGIPMLIRSMGPQIIITDEIGRPEDVPAVLQCLASGVTLITSVHGASIDDVMRSAAAPLIEQKIFRRLIYLTGKGGAGTLQEVVYYD